MTRFAAAFGESGCKLARVLVDVTGNACEAVPVKSLCRDSVNLSLCMTLCARHGEMRSHEWEAGFPVIDDFIFRRTEAFNGMTARTFSAIGLRELPTVIVLVTGKATGQIYVLVHRPVAVLVTFLTWKRCMFSAELKPCLVMIEFLSGEFDIFPAGGRMAFIAFLTEGAVVMILVTVHTRGKLDTAKLRI
jgi:hypothetical protein